LYNDSSQTLKQGPPRGCGISILEDVHNVTAQGCDLCWPCSE